MVFYELLVGAELDGLTNLQPSGGCDDPNFPYSLKLKCKSCQEITAEYTCITLSKQVDLPGHGIAHLVQKCKLCQSKGTIVMILGQGKPLTIEQSQKGEKTCLMVFDCRGYEPVEFSFGAGWKAESVHGISFEIDCSEGEFTEYDEKGGCPVKLGKLESTFKVVATTDPSHAAAAAASSSAAAPAHHYLDAILLDSNVCGDDGSMLNAAAALSRNSHRILISMEIADSVSRLGFHSDTLFAVEPHIVGADGTYVLIHARFMGECGEYFMYKANTRPSLCLLPSPPHHAKTFAIISREQSEDYLLVGIGFLGKSHEQRLMIYLSGEVSWSDQPVSYALSVPHPVSRFAKVVPTKAVAIGEKMVMWIDFDTAILLSDHSVNPPEISSIPFPPNRDHLHIECLVKPSFSSKLYRDVSFSNGLIKYVEVENQMTATSPYPELGGGLDEYSDEQLWASDTKYFKEPELLSSVDGWRIVIWSRPIEGHSWSDRQVLHLDDISSMSRTTDIVRYQKCHCHLPLLSPEDDIVYLRAVDKFGDQSGSVIAVDMTRKLFKVLGTHTFPTDAAYCLLKIPHNSMQVRSPSCRAGQPLPPLSPPQQAPHNFSRWNDV